MSYKPPKMKTIGENITVIRIRRGMSQAELAKALSVSQSMVSAIEKGDRTDIRTSTLRRFANALRCQECDILEGAEFEPSAAELAARKK